MSPSRSSRWLALASCTAGVAVFLIACLGGSDRSEGTVDSPAGPILAVTGNERGFIRPCGCSLPLLGGIEKRATEMAKLTKKHRGLILASVGDLVAKGGRQQRAKFETFLMAMDEMGYRALAPGRGELLLGLDYLVEQARGFESLAFLALNLTVGGKPVLARQLRIEGSPWILTGLMPAGSRVAGGRVQDPARSLSGLLVTLKESDRRMVLWSGGEKEARSLAASVPAEWQARVVFCFGGGFDAPQVVAGEGKVRLLSVGSKGRHIAVVQPDAKKLLESVNLGGAVPNDPTVTDILEGYRETVREMNLVKTWPRTTAPTTYAGAASCVECHEDTCVALAATGHMKAFAALIRTGDQHDPECVRCHVTGWGIKSGYLGVTETPDLLNVSCEACHGPCSDHVRDQGQTPGGVLGEKFCLVCHDADNSPGFAFEKYWPKMRHPK